MQQSIALGRFENIPMENRRNLTRKIQETFFTLIRAGEQKLGKEKIDNILESPDHAGQTVFMKASFFSLEISEWILNRNIDVAFVDIRWVTPQFIYEENFEKMLIKGVNPFVVSFRGKTEFGLRNFENIDEKFLEKFIYGKPSDQKTHAFYSFKDSECNEECKKSKIKCEDKMLKFKLYTGKRTFLDEISQEEYVKLEKGQAKVIFGTWHQNQAAFKLMILDEIEDVKKLDEGISNALETQAEYETALELSHQNVVKVLHLFRYQETDKINFIRSTKNLTVIVMEKHEKSIGELSPDERKNLPELFRDVLGLNYEKIFSIFISY